MSSLRILLPACAILVLGGEALVRGNTSGPIGSNGRSLTGTHLGFHGPGARELVYVDLAMGVHLKDKVLPDVKLSGTSFVNDQGAPLSESELRGGELTGCTIHDERQVRLRIRDVHAADEAEGKDVKVYTLEYQLAPHGTRCDDRSWQPRSEPAHWLALCPDPQQVCAAGGAANRDADNRGAIPVSGVWNLHEGPEYGGHKFDSHSRRISFSCPWGAIGKCVYQNRDGFVWKNPITDDHSDQLHQACVRAMRADYCGNGRSHTFDGTLLHIFRATAGRSASDPRYKLEALWDASGAVCVQSTRYEVDPTDPSERTHEFIQKTCPQRLKACPRRQDGDAAKQAATVGTEVLPLEELEQADQGD